MLPVTEDFLNMHHHGVKLCPVQPTVAKVSDHGFDIVHGRKVTSSSSLTKSDLAPRFRTMTDGALVASGMCFLAVKRGLGS